MGEGWGAPLTMGYKAHSYLFINSCTRDLEPGECLYIASCAYYDMNGRLQPVEFCAEDINLHLLCQHIHVLIYGDSLTNILCIQVYTYSYPLRIISDTYTVTHLYSLLDISPKNKSYLLRSLWSFQPKNKIRARKQ